TASRRSSSGRPKSAKSWRAKPCSNFPASRQTRRNPTARVRPFRGQTPLEAQQRADAFDRGEVLLMADRPHLTAVRERLVHGQVEAGVGLLEASPVERAVTARRRRAPAGGTAKGRMLDTLLKQQHFDASVRRGFQGLLPT